MGKQEFLIGCNYWASNAGCFMWKQFDEKIVKKDLAFLAEYGVNCLRIFPTWDDFQPIAENPMPKSKFFNSMSYRVRCNEKILNDQKFSLSGLSEEKLEQFKKVINIAKENGMKVIASFITGWMSGRRFIPPLLQGKDVITDPMAIVWECNFVADMVGELKDYENIIAWELGNECNCLSYDVDEWQTEHWVMSIVNAIRSVDNSRPIYSGMSVMRVQGPFNERQLARHVDVLTAHSYPVFTPYSTTENLHGMRSALRAACETSLYSSIGGKPCMMEEINALGPNVISDDFLPEYLERSLMTSLAVGTNGYLWWCAFEQSHLDFAPYDMFSLENYLGLSYANYEPKNVLLKMRDLTGTLKEIGALPPPKADAVVILPHFVDQWKLAYGAFVLGAQAGRHVDFMYEEDDFKDCDYYVLPSISMLNAIPHLQIKRLLKRVKDGAKLLITYGGGGIGEQERLTGLKIWGREKVSHTKHCTVNGKELSVKCENKLQVIVDTAEILVKDDNGEVFLAKNQLGKGTVYFCSVPLENVYTETYYAEDTALCEVYKMFFADKPSVLKVESNKCMVTVHELENSKTAVMLNNFDERTELPFSLIDGYKIEKVLCGEICEGKVKMPKMYAYIELVQKKA